MFTFADKDNDGQISFEEFKVITIWSVNLDFDFWTYSGHGESTGTQIRSTMKKINWIKQTNISPVILNPTRNRVNN